MDFEKICMIFTMKEPYYGILLSSMERVKSTAINTLAVCKSGNVFKLLYNTNFTDTLSIEEVQEVIKHEILHVAFNQLTMWEDKDVSAKEHKLRNYAMDLEVNSYLDDSIVRKLHLLYPADYNWPERLGTREYYKGLRQMLQQSQQQQMQSQPGKGTGKDATENSDDSTQNQSQDMNQNDQSDNQNDIQNNPQESSSTAKPQQNNSGQFNGQGQESKQLLEQLQSEQFDDHTKWPDLDSKAEQDMLSQQIEDMLEFAADTVEKNQGKLPSEMVGRIKLLRERKKPKPIADWKRYFRRYLGNEFTDLLKKSKRRPSRRFADAAGNRHQRKSHILVAIDTSGSISMPEYQEFFGQINTLTTTADFRIVECDAKIQYEYDYKGKPNKTLHGGGGTSFSPVIDYYIKEKRKYDALVYFTDGCASIPANTPKDTLWVISADGDQADRNKYKINGASVVYIPKKSI